MGSRTTVRGCMILLLGGAIQYGAGGMCGAIQYGASLFIAAAKTMNSIKKLIKKLQHMHSQCLCECTCGGCKVGAGGLGTGGLGVGHEVVDAGAA